MAAPIILALDFAEAPFPTADEPWCGQADLVGPGLCLTAAPTGIDVDSVAATASALLRNMTGGRFGVRRQTVRPYSAMDAQGGWPFGVSPTPTGSVLSDRGFDWWRNGSAAQALLLDGPANVLEVVVDGTYLPPSYADGVLLSGQTGIASGHAGFTAADVGQAIVGPGIPTATTIAAVNSGVQATMSTPATVSATASPFTLTGRTPGWFLYNRRMLVRASDVSWPVEQDLSQPSSAVGTWAVTYESGQAVPPEGKTAAVALACDLLKTLAGSGAACTPPDRVSSLTRQGVTISRLDPTLYLKDGWTGVKITDLWLSSLKAKRSRRRASIASPDTVRGARQ